MPLGPYRDWDACIADQLAKDHTRDEAEAICGALERDRKESRMATTLKTRDIKNVEILAVGDWKPSTGGDWEVEEATLDEIVANFAALKDVIVPPVKLGHSDVQGILQADGYPAAGWITDVRKKTDEVLEADFGKVPAKIADIIEAGGYRKVSVEVWKSFDVDGKTYSNVLTAVALLGNETPAVSTLDDIVALYARRAPIALSSKTKVRVAAHPAPKRRKAQLGGDASQEDRRQAIDTALRQKYGDGISGWGWPWVEETFDDYVVVTRDGRHWQIPYSIGSDGSVSLGTETEVEQTWRPKDPAGGAGETTKEEGMADLKRIATALGLADGATEEQILAAIDKAKAAGTQPKKLTREECEGMGGAFQEDGSCKMPDKSEAARLSARITELETTIAKRDATDAVDAAIRARKIAPAQKDWALAYAERDAAGFATFVKQAPEVIAAARGSEQDAPEEANDPVVKFQAKVQEKLKADPKLSITEAQALVSREEPELVRAAYGRS